MCTNPTKTMKWLLSLAKTSAVATDIHWQIYFTFLTADDQPQLCITVCNSGMVLNIFDCTSDITQLKYSCCLVLLDVQLMVKNNKTNFNILINKIFFITIVLGLIKLIDCQLWKHLGEKTNTFTFISLEEGSFQGTRQWATHFIISSSKLRRWQ